MKRRVPLAVGIERQPRFFALKAIDPRYTSFSLHKLKRTSGTAMVWVEAA